jgi:hypothetical protein
MINILIWTTNLCWRDINFVKKDHATRPSDSEVSKRVLPTGARDLGLLYEEIIPPNVEIISFAKT